MTFRYFKHHFIRLHSKC